MMLCSNDPYALSKFEAEQGLLALAKDIEMEVVIVRPPLVYGPGVKGNFYTMINWLISQFLYLLVLLITNVL